jgi:putative chitinase
MITITADTLRAAAPRCPKPDAWAAALNDAMLLHGIAQDVDYVVEFLAQCAHESNHFTRLEENLNYSPERLVQVWPKRFPTVAAATPYANAPHKLADFVYANRMGNGDVASGDGWNFRGRGALMVTGRANYAKVGKLIGDPVLIYCPDRLCIITVAAMACAAWWASDPNLNRLADDTVNDDDAADFVSITRKVNGGTVGLADRQKLRDAFSRALKSTA